MKNKRLWIAGCLVLVVIAFFVARPKQDQKLWTSREVKPCMGSIERFITSTGKVQPQNRLEMKPPVAGRVEQILVTEGQTVKAGDVVALMSSDERAALLDVAQSEGEKELSYWKEVYKPIPLVAPIDGAVIVSKMQPGQTVAQADPVVVLSDRLIVQAQVDETDIGRVKEGQKAVITLDAYPDVLAEAVVQHIYNESQTVNNVTIYQVDVLPKEVPSVFRSGMSANVRIIELSKDNILTIPLEAAKRGKEGDAVFVSQGKNTKPSKRTVTLGMADDVNVEVISGIDQSDTLVIRTQKAVSGKKSSSGANPFMPGGGGGRH